MPAKPPMPKREVYECPGCLRRKRLANGRPHYCDCRAGTRKMPLCMVPVALARTIDRLMKQRSRS